MRVQAFVIELRRALRAGRSVRGQRQEARRCRSGTSAAGRSSSASRRPASRPSEIDTVVHTHLHADHVGWDTRLEGGAWVPTFANARHLYTQRELDWCRKGGNPGIDGVYADSVAPILDAGLADVVERGRRPRRRAAARVDARPHARPRVAVDRVAGRGRAGERRLPAPPGAVRGAGAGPRSATRTSSSRARRAGACSARAADTRALFLGTHFASRPAGRVARQGDAFVFEPV